MFSNYDPIIVQCINTGPTMTAELTRFTGDQKCAMGEEATTCITQCTGELGC